jgi:hypothetical protein
MVRFLFHTCTNGALVQDAVGRRFDTGTDACIDAIRAMPMKLDRALDGLQNTYISTEIRDRTRAVFVIRAQIVMETR